MSATVTDTFHIIMQKGKVSFSPRALWPHLIISLAPSLGIEGGFAPPTPHARYIITRDTNSPTISISAQIRPAGTPILSSPRSQSFAVSDHINDIARLQQIMRDIPTQYPGAQDLYGRNTSIVDVTNTQGFHMSGSHAGSGIPHPTEEQKALFDEAVAIIEKWGA
ncbi:hypothetical protein J3R83DRAFT_13581 [Lanmaoa asiatica]|nr:hypothetical protein J3R83DRAFT_13581 [Lanmaoa asiatica]